MMIQTLLSYSSQFYPSQISVIHFEMIQTMLSYLSQFAGN